MHPEVISALGIAAAACAIVGYLLSLSADPPRWRRMAAGHAFALGFVCMTLADALLLDMTHLWRRGDELVEVRPYFVGVGIPLGVAQAWLALRIARRPPGERRDGET